MPIRPENRRRYPRDWQQIRARILERAGHRCEWCGVPNYAAGYRDATGRFRPTAGNQAHDAAGAGELSYRDAAELVRHNNEWCDGFGPNGERGIVIVLTIAHLDHTLESDDPERLRALCQRCHLTYDAKQHTQTARATREQKRGQLRLETP